MLFLIISSVDGCEITISIQQIFTKTKKKARELKVVCCTKKTGSVSINRIEFPYFFAELEDYSIQTLVVDLQSGRNKIADCEAADVDVRDMIHWPNRSEDSDMKLESDYLMQNFSYRKEAIMLDRNSDSFQSKYGSFYAIADQIVPEISPLGNKV